MWEGLPCRDLRPPRCPARGSRRKGHDVPAPNILLITTDQHNAEIMGCAGNAVVRTPHLDRLAREGVLFDQAFTPHPVCTPARTTIFTGQIPRRHGVPYNINLREDRADPPHFTGLAEDAVAFPEILARNGYRTALFGKLHTKQAGSRTFGLQTTRLAEGKGQFVEFGSGVDDYRRYLRTRGHDDSTWRTWQLPGYRERGWVTSPLPESDYIDTWTGTEAIRFLEAAESPFFAWVSFSGPHTPWDPPHPYDSMYDPAEIPMPARRAGELEEKNPAWVEHLAKTIPATPPTSQDRKLPGGIANAYRRFSERQVREMLAAYYGQITLIDAQVGRILETLDARGLTEDTVVLFTADHGDYLGNNWAFFKYGAQYDSLVRVPFIVSWPGRCEPGRRRDELVSLEDIAPTLLEAAGLEPAGPVDGVTLGPLLRRGERRWRDQLVWHTHCRCVMTREWKLIRWPNGFEELYDREADPHDLHNLAARPEYDAVSRELGEAIGV